MMATLPPPDVSMDMSSPGPRDDDIEIDLDDYPIGVELTDDERMAEDGEPVRPDTANDENMVEAEQVAITHEADMIDEPLPGDTANIDYDDELIDYDEEQTYPPLAQGATAMPQASTVDADIALVPHSVSVLEQSMTQTEASAAGQVPQDAQQSDAGGSTTHLEADAEKAALAAKPASPSEQHNDQTTGNVDREVQKPSTGVEEEALGEEEDGVEAEEKDEAETEHAEPTAAHEDHQTAAADTHAVAEGSGAAAHAPATHGTAEPTEEPHNASDDAGREGPDAETSQLQIPDDALHATGESAPSPTDTGLHPVIVTYRSSEFPLFKSRAAPNGLLEDDNLASLSLSELMSHCREELSINTGEKISEDQELCLTFEHMRSSLREDDPRAFEYSLKEILDVFVHLCHNDDPENVPAMHVTIELNWKFSKLFLDMRHAAGQGFGLSNFEYVNTANDDYYQEDEEYDVAEAEYAEDEGEFAEDDEAAHDEHEVDPAGHEEQAHVVDAVENNEAEATLVSHGDDDETATATGEASASDNVEEAAAASPATSATRVGDTSAALDDAHTEDVHESKDEPDAEQNSANPEEHAEADAEHYEDEGPHEEYNDEAHVNGYDDADGAGDAVDHFAYDYTEGDGNDVADDGADAQTDSTLANGVEDPSALEITAEDDFVEFDEEETAFEEESHSQNGEITAPETDAQTDGEASLFDGDEVHDQVDGVEKAVTKSPRGKRRLEENDDFDIIDFADEEPETKKVRAG